ncbi:PREDICTED: uncharacterized protein LOC108564433 isoform X2 [Nicrophorus vespilloides]|uniref:Uncharacterized protein LOC108564433 isoform X2 n=1 Tax=Nicrophorus vespilloides TaxID=110193 RepID=A0ABM1MWM1_NICVS|nr:PREDICTED: uncharacterized protein LOC108564433 isoform X2 [Nicrophorus vespilloides]
MIILLLTIISGLFCTVWVVAVNEVSYSFKYSVDEPKLGIVTHHWEERNGGKVRGGYSLLEPNGKVRVVEYQVDGNKGFKAFVTFRRPPVRWTSEVSKPIPNTDSPGGARGPHNTRPFGGKENLPEFTVTTNIYSKLLKKYKNMVCKFNYDVREERYSIIPCNWRRWKLGALRKNQ